MAEPATAKDDDSTKVSSGSRVLGWLAAIALLIIVGVLFMHVFAPPIAPDEAPPASHPQSACIACHIVTGSTEGAESR